jgi:hypothetical protein
MLDPSEPVHGALAMLDGKAVGLVHFLFHRSTWTVSNVSRICSSRRIFAARGSASS